MMRAAVGFCAAGFVALMSQSAYAADQCGPLQRIISVDTVVGPGGYMLVPVKIGDAQRLMLFDTGGAINGVTQQTAQELHLPTYDSRVGLVGVNGAKSTRVAIIPSMTIGTAESKSVQYMILPNNMPPGIAGVLAPATGVDIDLDFAGRKLSFFSTDHCEGKVVYWPAQTVAVVSMRVAGSPTGGAGVSTEHIIIPVTLDGKQLDAMLDTGATNNVLNLRVATDRFSLDVTAPDVQQIGQFNNNPSAKIYRKRFGTLSFEGVIITNPVLDLIPDLQTKALGDERRTGSLTRPPDRGLPDLIIGMPVLSKTHMYIAYRERKVYVTAAGDVAQVQPASLTQPAAGANFSGSWKIASQAVRPVCEITQSGNELKGSCVGPAAKGEVTGTVAGQTVRWQWKRFADNNGNTSLWNFSGTISGDNSIAGFVEQNGRSAPFTATKQ
jgi:predicted aspartyl protease